MAHPPDGRTAAVTAETRTWDGYGGSEQTADILLSRVMCAIPVPVSYFSRKMGGHRTSPDTPVNRLGTGWDPEVVR